MSDAPQGPGWWQAADGKYYPPAGPEIGPVAAPRTSGLAITSLVTGILSIVLCPGLGIVGLVTGFMAKRRIRESNGEETGDGLATGGIVTSIVGLVLIGGVILVAILAVTFLGTAASSKFSSVGTAITTE